MHTQFFGKVKLWLLVILFLFVGVTDAKAEIELTDTLTMTGFLRQMCAVNIGTGNPRTLAENDGDKNRFNLIRTMLEAEFDYVPTDAFKVHAKTRFIYDMTYMLDSNLGQYDTRIWMPNRYGTDLRTGSSRVIGAELYEIWASYEWDAGYVKVGKQQIAWGEVPALRLIDLVNPLDKSWHLTLEPEEYENIRIAEWMGRLYVSLPRTMTGIFEDVFIDTWINPGDLHYEQHPAVGSPYQDGFSGSMPNEDYDRRGDIEWGARIGFNMAGAQLTFSYLDVYMDYATFDLSSGTLVGEFPKAEVYGVNFNYAFNNPIAATLNVELSHTPDQAWHDRSAPAGLGVAQKGYTRLAIWAARDFYVVPKWTAMAATLLFYIHRIEDDDEIQLSPGPYGPGNSLKNFNMHTWYLKLTQEIGKGRRHTVMFNPMIQTDSAYTIKASYKWSPSEKWKYELMGLWNGGSGAPLSILGSGRQWQDEVYARITYSF